MKEEVKLSEHREIIPMPGHHVSDIEIDEESRIDKLIERSHS